MANAHLAALAAGRQFATEADQAESDGSDDDLDSIEDDCAWFLTGVVGMTAQAGRILDGWGAAALGRLYAQSRNGLPGGFGSTEHPDARVLELMSRVYSGEALLYPCEDDHIHVLRKRSPLSSGEQEELWSLVEPGSAMALNHDHFHQRPAQHFRKSSAHGHSPHPGQRRGHSATRKRPKKKP